MQSDVVLNAAHWMYLVSVAAIILTMILRANVVVPSVIGTFLVVLAITGNPISALIGIFSASFVAAKELFNIFLVITFMTALLNALKTLQADVRMVQPFRRVMRGGHSSFVIIALCTYVISLFFWPACSMAPASRCWWAARPPPSPWRWGCWWAPSPATPGRAWTPC